ncbi:hypothetical protein [Bacteroides pyogenes]|jgi:hypothetical protein|uniref:Uncharacterized protein n=1 Tax=Bacteroides pyogenes TaxID=310300 RepID=A0A5D3E9J4_9BACE|nr:hypothetical protein [Bacteroides pyogenes]TYK32827.1 hypothetical protein FNJ60_10475 [Bacteroides pyogenes]
MNVFKKKLNVRNLCLKMYILFGFFCLSSSFIPQVTYAQSGGGLKITSLSEVENKAKEGSDTVLKVAKYVLAAVLGVALIFVIYALATNQPHAKDFLLGWIVAVVVIMVAFLII